MIEQERVRNHFLGEIETEIVGRQYHKAKVFPGEQVNLERQAKNAHDRRAILVENGHFDPVGYLPKHGFVAGPADRPGKIHLDGYVPQSSTETEEELHAAR